MNSVFENIYKTHYAKLYTLAFRMTGSVQDAEDVLQTSFLNAYKAFPRFREKSSVYTWLYRIVLNTSRNHFRKWEKLRVDRYAEEKGIPLEEAYAGVNSFGQVEEEAFTNQIRETCLQMFMNCMPAKYRTVYTLRVMLHLSVKETAEVLEISADAVKTNLYRARKIAKSHLEGRCSLVKPGAMCNCRSFAAFVKAKKREKILMDIKLIQKEERAAVENYTEEMKAILEVDHLYDALIAPTDYTEFLKRIKKLVKSKQLTLLDYSHIPMGE